MPVLPTQYICTENFPVYKANRHLGKSYAQCPFSTQSTDKRTRMLLRDLILDNAGPDLLEIDSNGDFVVSDINTAVTNTLGYGLIDHTTISGNLEGTTIYPTNDYLKPTTFSGVVYMQVDSRRGVYGVECAFNNCPYRQNNNGKRYFHS